MKNSILVQYGLIRSYFNPASYNGNLFVNLFTDVLFVAEEHNIRTGYDFREWIDEKDISQNNNTVILNADNFKFSKLYLNMTDDSLTTFLDPDTKYKDMGLNDKFVSIILPPWTSQILFTDKDLNNMPEINPLNVPLKFGITEQGNSSDTKWLGLYGNNIYNEIELNAPAGFKISSFDNKNFSGSLKVFPVNGELNEVVFVRFEPEYKKSYFDYINIYSGNLVLKAGVSGISR